VVKCLLGSGRSKNVDAEEMNELVEIVEMIGFYSTTFTL
jgi:hypothetical protein